MIATACLSIKMHFLLGTYCISINNSFNIACLYSTSFPCSWLFIQMMELSVLHRQIGANLKKGSCVSCQHYVCVCNPLLIRDLSIYPLNLAISWCQPLEPELIADDIEGNFRGDQHNKVELSGQHSSVVGLALL